MRIIDLSLVMDEDALEPFPIRVKRVGHAEGAGRVGRRFISRPGDSMPVRLKKALMYLMGSRRIDRRSFPDGMFLSHETVTASVHCGTHVDAPFHFGPVCEGSAAKTIDEMPIEWCYGDGVVLDMTALPPGGEITPDDIDGALDRIGYALKPGDIVLIRTGADRYFGGREYFYRFPGLGEAGLKYLLDMDIRTVGTDAPGLDRPFGAMVEDYYRTGDGGRLWPVHMHGRRKEYCHIERLANLDALPAPYGFKFACFPVKIKNVGAAWARAVAIFEE